MREDPARRSRGNLLSGAGPRSRFSDVNGRGSHRRSATIVHRADVAAKQRILVAMTTDLGDARYINILSFKRDGGGVPVLGGLHHEYRATA